MPKGTNRNGTNNYNHGTRKIPYETVFEFRTESTPNATILSSPDVCDVQAINAIKSSITSSQKPSNPLIECEFPASQTSNKLGDGSMRSVIEAGDMRGN